MRVLGVLFALLLTVPAAVSVVPSAAAECVGDNLVCVDQNRYGRGSCEGMQHESEGTRATLVGGVVVLMHDHRCAEGETWRSERHLVRLDGPYVRTYANAGNGTSEETGGWERVVVHVALGHYGLPGASLYVDRYQDEHSETCTIMIGSSLTGAPYREDCGTS